MVKSLIEVTKFKFITTISQMGKEKKIIWIPKKYHKEIKQFEGKQIRVQIDDEI
jgi:hypothetical protein